MISKVPLISNSPLVCVVRLLLHHLQDAFARACAVLRVAVDCDGLLERTDVVLAVHVHAGPAVLGDLSYRAALAADDGADHLRRHQQPQREVRLATGAAAAGHSGVLRACPRTSPRHFGLEQFHQQLRTLEVDPVQAGYRSRGISKIKQNIVINCTFSLKFGIYLLY